MNGVNGPQQLGRLRGGLVVSCQARPGNPLHGPRFMAAVAHAAALGGAAGIRANGVADVGAILAAVDLPLMAIDKQDHPDSPVKITPTRASAEALLATGARLIALDGTRRPRPGGERLHDIVAAIHAAGGLALADIATLADAQFAVNAGADAVGTTLSGYTDDSPKLTGPDLGLVEALVQTMPVPVFAEGRYWTPLDARQALALGASFVVVGTAITNPMEITRRFIDLMRLPGDEER
jgi:N-acylglucosamine-6-phosphate 2-epimerase